MLEGSVIPSSKGARRGGGAWFRQNTLQDRLPITGSPPFSSAPRGEGGQDSGATVQETKGNPWTAGRRNRRSRMCAGSLAALPGGASLGGVSTWTRIEGASGRGAGFSKRRRVLFVAHVPEPTGPRRIPQAARTTRRRSRWIPRCSRRWRSRPRASRRRRRSRSAPTSPPRTSAQSHFPPSPWRSWSWSATRTWTWASFHVT